MTFQDFHNLKSGHKRHDRIIQMFFVFCLKLSKNFGFHRNQCKMQILYGYVTQSCYTLFQNFIHGVYSVLSLYAVFAFQNYRLWWAETKGQRCFRKIEIIHGWHSVSSVAQNEILWTSAIQAVGRQCFKWVLSKFQYRQASGYWNF